jgi:hypothetical protein
MMGVVAELSYLSFTHEVHRLHSESCILLIGDLDSSTPYRAEEEGSGNTKLPTIVYGS